MKTVRLEDANRSDNMILNVEVFGDTLSFKYCSCRDVIAINTKMTAGAVVKMVSIICPSKINHLVCFLDNSNYCVKYCCDDDYYYNY